MADVAGATVLTELSLSDGRSLRSIVIARGCGRSLLDRKDLFQAG